MSDTAHEFLDELAVNQNTTPEKLHTLDTSDIAISREALAGLRTTAIAVLGRLMSADSLEGLTLSDIVKIFASKLFWNETDGGLIMCAELGARTFCVPIPAGHWNVNAPERLH